MSLSKEQILHANDIDVVPVDVPQWGGQVFIRQFSAAERDRLLSFKRENPDNVGIREQLVLLGCCDEAGKPLFTTEDLPALSAKNHEPMELVGYEIMKLNGLAAEAIEDAEKN